MKFLTIAVLSAIMLNCAPVYADDWNDLYGALNSAMWQQNDQKLIALLEQGVDINTRNSDGWTLLHIASDQGKPAFVSLLLNRGADPSIKTNYGKTAFDVAGSAQIKRMLTDAMAARGGGGLPTFDPAKAWTEARWAIEYNQQDELVRLLDTGLDVNARNSDGWTLLMIAAWKGSLRSVEYLVGRGADQRARNNKGETAAQLTSDTNVRAFLGGEKNVSPQPTENNYCTRMYHEATRLCDTGSAGSFCRIRAANDAQECKSTGRWP
ncbi:ankyrin repeat protein [Azospirillum sp. BE72]|nr:ankyrin repeat protein [Azospirillum sp. BE72]